MNKKADVWISAVIYVALAITILTIVLAAGMPVINKMRDKNVAVQTKELMHDLDNTIRDVVREGPGARRTPSINIGRGEFTINQDADEIKWVLQNSKFMLSQPDVPPYKEGNLEITTTTSQVEGEYNVEILLKYSKIDIVSEQLNVLSGQYNLIITNERVVDDKIQVSIKELSNI